MPSNALTQQIFFRAIAMPTTAISLLLEPGQKVTVPPVSWEGLFGQRDFVVMLKLEGK